MRLLTAVKSPIMARESKAEDKKLVKGFEDSLMSVLGESGAKAVMKLGNVPGDKFDSGAIDSSLEKVFGSSQEGLSVLQSSVLRGMSETLDVTPVDPGEVGKVGFASSLELLAQRYRLKEKAGFGIVGITAGMISSICCLGPIAFALLGLASLSSSLALAMDLTSAYKPVELAASLGFLATTVFFQLRRHGQCSLSGLRRNLSYVIIPGTALLVSYALLNYWLGVTFFGGAGSLLP
jgi:hypothetical protein